MMTSPYEWKFLERDKKPKTQKKTQKSMWPQVRENSTVPEQNPVQGTPVILSKVANTALIISAIVDWEGLRKAEITQNSST